MYSLLCLLTLLVATLALKNDTSQGQCNSDPDCITWSDIDDLSKVPRKVENCCTILKIDEDEHCSFGKTSYEWTVYNCASFCPTRIAYEWGPEVFYLNQGTCDKDHMPCDLPADSRAIFKPAPLPDYITVPRVIGDGILGGFNDRAIMAYSGDQERKMIVDGHDQGYGGYWTFVPLYKETCGTYTESIMIPAVPAGRCDTVSKGWKKSYGNVCVKEPVTDPHNNHSAVGITQLIPVSEGKNGIWQNQAESRYWSNEYRQLDVAWWPYNSKDNSVRQGFGKFQNSIDRITQTGKPEKAATAYAIDENSPMTDDCLQAAGEFYAPIWNQQLNPYTDGWSNDCQYQTPENVYANNNHQMKPCAVVGSYGTCRIQLILESTAYVGVNHPDAAGYYSELCHNRDGGGLWSLLSAFQTIFKEASDEDLGRTAGSMEMYGDDFKCNSTVAFVPSNGAMVTLKT